LTVEGHPRTLSGPSPDLRVNRMRHLARKLFVIEGYGVADESQLGRV